MWCVFYDNLGFPGEFAGMSLVMVADLLTARILENLFHGTLWTNLEYP